jgi:hypothetical protein
MQVEPLREQSERAKKYLILRDELRVLEISVWLENLDALKTGARKLEADFRAAEQQRDEARAALDALYAEGEQYGERMREKDMEAERIRTEAAQLDGQVKDQEAAIAVLESAIVHNRENIERARQELEETGSRAGSLELQAAEQDTKIEEIDRRLEELNAALDALLEQARTAAEQAGGAQSEAEALRGREAMAVAAAADARAEVAAITAENGQITERKAAVEQEMTAAEEQLENGGYIDMVDQAAETGAFCHNAYKSEELRIHPDGRIFVGNFDKCRRALPLADLAFYLRRYFRKTDGDPAGVWRIVESYGRHCPLSDGELMVLQGMLIYPEKFLRLVNEYYNRRRACVSPAMQERLAAAAKEEKNGRILKDIIEKGC